MIAIEERQEIDSAIQEALYRAKNTFTRGFYKDNLHLTSYTKDDASPVTDLDLQIAYQIKESLSEKFSHIPIICEEAEGSYAGDPSITSLRFVVDPVDGTANLHKNPEACWASIGLIDLAVNEGVEFVTGNVINLASGKLMWECVQKRYDSMSSSKIQPAPIVVGVPENYRISIDPAKRDLLEESLIRSSIPGALVTGSICNDFYLFAAGAANELFNNHAKLWDIAGFAHFIPAMGIRSRVSNKGDLWTLHLTRV